MLNPFAFVALDVAICVVVACAVAAAVAVYCGRNDP